MNVGLAAAQQYNRPAIPLLIARLRRIVLQFLAGLPRTSKPAAFSDPTSIAHSPDGLRFLSIISGLHDPAQWLRMVCALAVFPIFLFVPQRSRAVL